MLVRAVLLREYAVDSSGRGVDDRGPPGCASSIMSDPFLARFASAYKQAEATLVLGVDRIRKGGGALADYVVVVADTQHEATRLMIRDMSASEVDATERGFAGVLAKANVSRVLRICRVDEWADVVDTPVDPGNMRVLFSAAGKVIVADIPAFPPLPATGSA